MIFEGSKKVEKFEKIVLRGGGTFFIKKLRSMSIEFSRNIEVKLHGIYSHRYFCFSAQKGSAPLFVKKGKNATSDDVSGKTMEFYTIFRIYGCVFCGVLGEF